MSEKHTPNSRGTKKPTTTETDDQLLAILGNALATLQERGRAKVFPQDTNTVILLTGVEVVENTLKDIFHEK